MGNEQKVENIKKLIQSSTILSIPEKEEWLGMVDLMNDKQMSELMEILGQPAASPNTTPAPLAAPINGTNGIPSLSHLSNLPNTIPQSTVPKTPAIATSPPPAQSVPPPVTKQAAPVTAPTVSPFGAVTPKTAPAPTPLSPFSSPRSPSPVVAPKPPVAPTAVLSKPAVSKNPIAPVYKSAPSSLRSLADLAAITVADLRAQGVESIISGAKNLSTTEGYFAVFESFELSPLYKEYIRAGERALSGKTVADKDALTAGEFELVADILSAIRVNRS